MYAKKRLVGAMTVAAVLLTQYVARADDAPAPTDPVPSLPEPAPEPAIVVLPAIAEPALPVQNEPPKAAPDQAKKPSTGWAWAAPAGLLAVTSASFYIADSQGLSTTRIVSDTLVSSAGATVGVLLTALFLATSSKNTDVAKLVLCAPAFVASLAVGGTMLSERLLGYHPYGSVWPSAGGFAVGAVIDLAAVGAWALLPQDGASSVATLALAPLTLGATTTAGFALGRP